MRGLLLAARCALAVVVTTVAVQLWGMALQDDVPLPAPIFSLPATDDAVAAATPKGRVHRSQPAVVVSAGLLAAARQPRPEKSGGTSAAPAAEPVTTPVTPSHRLPVLPGRRRRRSRTSGRLPVPRPRRLRQPRRRARPRRCRSRPRQVSPRLPSSTACRLAHARRRSPGRRCSPTSTRTDSAQSWHRHVTRERLPSTHAR